jgi:hypothetical protein
MSQNIIRFFNDFAATFPSDKSAEKAAFEQNIAQVFADDLATAVQRSGAKNISPQVGNLVFWRTAAQEIQCGIVLNDKTSVLRLDGNSTEKLPLPKEVIGVADARGLLERKFFTPPNIDPLKCGFLYYLDDYYYPIEQGQNAYIDLISGDLVFSDGRIVEALNPNTKSYYLTKSENLTYDIDLGYFEVGIVYSKQILEKKEALAQKEVLGKSEIKHFFKFDSILATALDTLIQKIKNKSKPTDSFKEDSVEHGLLVIQLPNKQVKVLRTEASLPYIGQPDNITSHIDLSEELVLQNILGDYPFKPQSIWRDEDRMDFEDVGIQRRNGTPFIAYQRLKIVLENGVYYFTDDKKLIYALNKPNTNAFDSREDLLIFRENGGFSPADDGRFIYIKRLVVRFYDGDSEPSRMVIKNLLHTHPDNSANHKLAPSGTDLNYNSPSWPNKDLTQIIYHFGQNAVIFFYPRNVNERTATIDNYNFYDKIDKPNRPDHSAVIVIPYPLFKNMIFA